MRFIKSLCLVVAITITLAEAKRVRVRTRPQQEPIESEQLVQESESEEERRPIIQYFQAEPRADREEQRIVLIPTNSEEDYQEVQYARPAPRTVQRADPPSRPRVSYQQPTTISPRRKDDVPKEPPVQTIRNYNKVNDDGSFTFGYEAADGSFKEETRGTDCVVRGKYGYIDPDGNKREFTYVSGNPCDPNNPEGNDEVQDSVEDSEENVPQNFPRRPTSPRPTPPPTRPPTRPPTTVFSNVYAHQGISQEETEEEENLPQTIQIGQRPRPVPARHPQQQTPQQFVTQRPRIQIVNTTPTPTPTQYYHSTNPVSITSRPYKPQTNPPATTYKPPIQIVTQKIPAQTPPAVYSSTRYGSQHKGNVDFEAEFKKFQKENVIQSSTPSLNSPTQKPFKASPNLPPSVTNNPIYESQLIFDPSSGQYDTQLYQQLPQTEGDFSLNHRIQPYVHQPTAQPQQIVNYSPQPIYRPPQPLQLNGQSPQQLYQKQQQELQFANSQQLFAQQLELQQSQLHRDRIEAAKKGPQGHRFEVRPSPVRLQQSPAGQQYYYIQPNANQGGQIDAFLRGHNVAF